MRNDDICLAKIIVYQFIYFWNSVVLSRKKALDAENVATNQTYRGEQEINFGLEFLGILAGYVSWNLGTNFKSSIISLVLPQLCFNICPFLILRGGLNIFYRWLKFFLSVFVFYEFLFYFSIGKLINEQIDIFQFEESVLNSLRSYVIKSKAFLNGFGSFLFFYMR